MISAGQLREIADCSANLAAIYAPFINRYAPAYRIDTNRRLAMWVAQVAHESGRFRRTVENLNYSAAGLLATWPTRFDEQTARRLARKPELIANHVYGGRYGNNTVGDGWKYRGRGLIQLTFRDNYAAFAEYSGRDVIAMPQLLESNEGAVESACWYWMNADLNRFADTLDIRSCTRVINGGYNGIADREALYAKAREVLSWS